MNPTENKNNGYLLEEHNEELVDGLSEKLGSLKRVAIAIGDDVREQNRLLNEMVGDIIFCKIYCFFTQLMRV